MAKLTGELIAENATWLTIVGQLFSTRMSALLKPHGLTLGQFSILQHLMRVSRDDGCRVSDIAAAVEVGQPAVTKAVHKFQTMGLVDLVPGRSDRRAIHVRLTAKTGKMMTDIQQDIGPDLFRVFDELGAEDAAQLAALLKKLGRWLDANRLAG